MDLVEFGEERRIYFILEKMLERCPRILLVYRNIKFFKKDIKMGTLFGSLRL